MTDTAVLLDQAQKDGIQKIVVGAVIQNNGKNLVLRRTSDDFMGGLVELPSGGVDAGEDLITALSREVQEETGLTIENVKSYISSFDYTSGSGKKARQFNFLATTQNDNVVLNPEEHDWFEWIHVPSDTYRDLNISAHTRSVLEKANNF